MVYAENSIIVHKPFFVDEKIYDCPQHFFVGELGANKEFNGHSFRVPETLSGFGSKYEGQIPQE